MAETVLITGGAGFIGSHLARHLLGRGFVVRALDNLTPQVHGDRGRPSYLPTEVELQVGDVRDPVAVERSLRDCDYVVHLAARVGVGQSMYEIADYASANAYGTGVLLQALVDRPPRKLLVASSMSVYGEGLYRDAGGGLAETVERSRTALEAGWWEPCGRGRGVLTPLTTPEWKRASMSSVYALGKFDQERMCLLFGSSYSVPTVALRFFNVYGRDQALSNPYTGVLAIFAARLLNGQPPLIFEDGLQRRDFVSVHDVVGACGLALDRSHADGCVLNVGSGRDLSVREVAEELARVLGREDVRPSVTGKYRVGDIRHCFADIERARTTLGYEPRVQFEQGIRELAEALAGQLPHDAVEMASAELAARGLTL